MKPAHRSLRLALRTLFLTAALAFMLPAAAQEANQEREVTLPVRLDLAYIKEAFDAQLFSGSDIRSTRLWDDGTGCNFLSVSDPLISTNVTSAARTINVRMASDARIGQQVGDRCVLLLDWSGFITTIQEVDLEPGSNTVRFRIVDSVVEDREIRFGFRVGTLWEWIKQYVHPRLAAVRIDLNPALEDLRGVLALVLPGQTTPVSETLDSISMHSVEVVDDGLLANLQLRVPAQPVSPAAPAPALSPAELARFESAWQGWDSFITFVVKHFASGTAAPEVRRELLDVLIQARYDLLKILAQNAQDRGADPVRALFVETWSRLAPVLRELSTEMPGERGLNLLSFITAADALQTLDALGPQFNLDISVEGLRRMARILAPDTETDPLIYDENVDPALRELFDFGPPPAMREESGSMDQGWWQGLVPAARAAEALTAEQMSRLNEWIPKPADIETYLALVHRLLDSTSRDVADHSRLDPDLHELYRVLVLATAWQETCWRQYRRVEDQVVVIRSPAGAVGLMQVVPVVWRGFYDPQGLTRDIGYNAVAGSEILMHYLTQYAIARGEDRQPGGRNNLAWATYAAYNGGPRQFRRYRESGTDEDLRRIDLAFRDKFRLIREGNELAVRSCYSD